MADAEIADPVQPGIEIENPNISPEVRATLVINLINEITVTGAEDDQHDLTLLFLGFTQPVLDNLQRLTPTLVNVPASLSTA